jgi:ribosomal-protein-alanine N-acetyltransferase
MNGTIEIVPMQAGHVDALMAFEHDMFGPEAWSASAYRDELADRRTRSYVVAEQDGELVGWAGVRVIGREAEILTVGVVPAARRRGIARLLLATLLNEARARGATEVFLEVRVDNVAARTLYDQAGFATMGLRQGYYDGGRVDAVTMRLGLS